MTLDLPAVAPRETEQRAGGRIHAKATTRASLG